MGVGAEYREKAISNLNFAINTNSGFPARVFRHDWEHFLFFDSDRIFEPSFVDWGNRLLKIEMGNCAYICDLDSDVSNEKAEGPSSFCFGEDDTGEAFVPILCDPSKSATGWIYNFGRFTCISDVGQWCIYCERDNEIAVMAFRDKEISRLCHSVGADFKAEPVAQALAGPLSYGFMQRPENSKWLHRLMESYSA